MLARYTESVKNTARRRSSLFDLILVQIIYDQPSIGYDEVADHIMRHPLLINEEPVDGDEVKKSLESLSNTYNIALKLGKKSSELRKLAQVLYQRYSQELLDLISEDKKTFEKLYSEAEKFIE